MSALLLRADGYEPEYRGGLTSHLPMALTALHRLGASEARCREYMESYVQARQLLPLNSAGDFAREAAVIAATLAEQGRTAVLAALLPQLLRSVGSQAFHGLIRVAYALEADDDRALAYALAYWESAPFELPAGNGDVSSTRKARDLFRAAEALYAPHRGQFRGRLISTTMAYAASLPEFKQLTAALPRDQDLLDQLAALALALFAATGDFTALHALTGTHAFRVVSGHLEDAREATQFLTVALLAAYADMGAPPLPSDEVLAVLRATPAPDWSELVARAIEADDDHVIKVTYSAREEDALYHDPLYRVAIHRYQQRHR